MSAYIQLNFKNISPAQSEILVAGLNEYGFEGFEEGEEELKAFIKAELFDEDIVKNITGLLDLGYTQSLVEETNWNVVWESNFQPVVIDDFAGIRAHFHEPLVQVAHEIIITPKMSFGTGHHATTWMMIDQMRNIRFNGKSVLDFGTGTGILAILAEKLGAENIIALDHDDWSIENARENLLYNQTGHIILHKADSAGQGRMFDIILANINKNILLENMPALANQLSKKGILLMSGLLAEDEAEIMTSARECGLIQEKRVERHNWLCLRYSA
jgi:ribosomal protein L11 methyltransferase